MEKNIFSLSKMKRLLVFLLATCVTSTLGGYTLEYVNNGSGIYFDPVGKAKVLSQPLELFTYVNLSFVETQLASIISGMSKANDLCTEVGFFEKEDYCAKNLQLLTRSFADCQKQCHNMINLLMKKRPKRELFALIDAVASGLSIITTVRDLMSESSNKKDNPDMSKYDDYLKTLGEDQERLAAEFDTKIIGIESSLKIIKSDVSSIHENEDALMKDLKSIRKIIEDDKNLSEEDRKIINKHDTLIKDLNSKTDQQQEVLREYGETLKRNNRTLNEHRRQINELNIKDKMLSMLMILENEISALQRNLDTIVDSIMLGKRNVLSTAVVSHQQIYDELSKNIHIMKDGDELLYHLTKSSMQSIIDGARISTFVLRGNLIFALKIPTVSKVDFVLYKSVPFPMRIDSSTFAYLEPSVVQRGNLLLSVDKTSFSHVDLDRDCERVKDTFLCKANRLYSMGSKTTCETTLLTQLVTSMPEECEAKMMHGHVDIWQQLGGNRWIFVQSNKTKLTIDCTMENTSEELIIGSGILSMPLNCTASTPYVQLVYSDENVDLQSPQIFFNIVNDDCCTPDKIKKIKSSLPPTNFIHPSNVIRSNNVIHSSNVMYPTDNMNAFKDHSNQYKVADQGSAHDGSFLPIFMYLAASASLIFSVVALYMMGKRIMRKSNTSEGHTPAEFMMKVSEHRT